MQGPYPFIDIIALSKIRPGFAKAHAQAVFSANLDHLIWINAAGADLLGIRDIYNAHGTQNLLNPTSQRQISSQLSSLQPDESRTLALRLNSQLQQFQLAKLPLPDGSYGILLECTSSSATAGSVEQVVLQGLDSSHSHAALLDANGLIIAHTTHFPKTGITQNTLADLTVEVADMPDKMLKRRIRAADRSVPGAIIRLLAEPALHLLYIVADEAEFADIQVQSTIEAAAVSATPSSLTPAVSAPFTFNPEAPITRFVWKLDADGVFTELSESFAQVLGPKASDIIGRRFNEVANVFALDPHHEIAQLLQSRTTWSGRRVMWPAEGTSLHVPVELAALPVFSREREFNGFNGFGVVHVGDALPDPEKIGLCLSGDLPARIEEQAIKVAEPETLSPAAIAAEVKSILPKRSEDLIAEIARQQVQQTEKQAKEQKTLETKPVQTQSGLSEADRNTFREIADRLRRQGIATQRDDSPFAKTPTKETAAEPVQQQQNLLFRDEVASKIDRPLLKLAEFNKSSTLVEKGQLDEMQPTASLQVGEPAVSESAPFTAPSTSDDMLTQSKPIASKMTDQAEILAMVPFPILLHTDGNVVYANTALLELTGYASTSDINISGGIDALFNTDRDDESSDNSMILRHRDGGEHSVDVHLQMVPWGDQKVLMLSIQPKTAAVAPDHGDIHGTEIREESEITREASLRLQTQVEELTSILDTATDGVILIDNDGLIRSLNHSAAALFGYEENEIRGKSFSMLFAIESQRSALDYLNSLSDNGVMSVLNDGREVIGREAQGGFIPMFMTLGKLPRSNSFCAVLRDITQWKRAEEELTSARREAEQASKQKTEFLARISHEIRTPLNAIIGFSELMADEKFGPIGNQRYRDYLRDINRSGNHVLTLVNDLLDISKIEAGAQEMDFEAVSLNDAISDAVSLMQPQANRERVIIRSSFASNLPEIVADTRSIKQIALNLLSNAVRFTQAGGQVIVSTSYELNGDVIMRVRDTGVGMDKNEIEQALKPFRQVHNRLRNRNESGKDWRNEGTGLGLPLTKAMVEANRAQLTINSNPGQGTVVEITFPPTRVLAD